MIKLFTRKQHEENHKRENAKRVVIVKANPRCAGQQAEDMHMIERLCKDILIAETHDDVLIQTAIAVGYANAMRIHGIIEDTEGDCAMCVNKYMMIWLKKIAGRFLKGEGSAENTV